MLQLSCQSLSSYTTSPWCYSRSHKRAAETFPWQLISELQYENIAHIILVWMDGGAFVHCCYRALYLSMVGFQWRSVEKIILNKHWECLQQPRKETICFLKNWTQIICIMWGSAVLNLLSLRNSTRCMGVRFVPRKVLQSFYDLILPKSTFFPQSFPYK